MMCLIAADQDPPDQCCQHPGATCQPGAGRECGITYANGISDADFHAAIFSGRRQQSVNRGDSYVALRINLRT